MGIWIYRRLSQGFRKVVSCSRATPREGHRAEVAPAFVKELGAAESGSKGGAAETYTAPSAIPSVTFVKPGSIGHPKDGSASYAVWDNGTVGCARSSG